MRRPIFPRTTAARSAKPADSLSFCFQSFFRAGPACYYPKAFDLWANTENHDRGSSLRRRPPEHERKGSAPWGEYPLGHQPFDHHRLSPVNKQRDITA